VAGSDVTPDLSIAIATKGDLLVAGYGDAFVKAVLTPVGRLSGFPVGLPDVMAAVGGVQFGIRVLRHLGSRRPIGQAFSPPTPVYNLNYKPTSITSEAQLRQHRRRTVTLGRLTAK